jgi:hypothetical protein
MARVTKVDRDTRQVIQAKTTSPKDKKAQGHNWWKARSKTELAQQLIDTAAYLKDQQQFRWRQASIHSRMYGNQSVMGYASTALQQAPGSVSSLPVDRPTMNVVQSCADTLVSRLAQSKPRPIFLTDNADYKQRTLAKQLNQFLDGELYQTRAQEIAERALLDAAILGDGCIKVIETDDQRVGLERTLATELLVDANDAFYGKPRSMYQFKLVDRSVLAELFPDVKSKIESAEQGYPDAGSEAAKTMSDQVMLVEGWHLPSSKKATDGRHVIACTSGVILDEEWTKNEFPFVFITYSPRLVGFWSQGLAEQLTGTQLEINKLLVTISQSISLVGVPRVFVEDGSKVVKAHLNNQVGSIVTYRGTKPEYEVAPCVPQELYQQLQRLIDYAYQQSGISALSATSQKPAGLNSGEAIRSYDDLQSDRFATLNKRYDKAFVDLSYKIIEKAREIAERDGSYQTVYPNKDGTREVDLPASKLLDNPFVIQCYDSSSLPRDPAGRKQSIVEDMQAGIITLEQGRRLLNYPDLEQDDKLELAGQERILKQLDQIVESGDYEPPDSFTPIELGLKLVAQYYNLYAATNLEERKLKMVRDYQVALVTLQQAMMPPAPPAMPGQDPAGTQAVPEAQPTSPMLPNAQ